MLRENAGLSQGAVEVVAELGEHYFKRIELGQVARPQRATLERILNALQATYDDRRHVLEAYSYTIANPLPTAHEIAAAQAAFHNIAATLTVPAQLLDCAQRMQAWNRLLDFTIGRLPDIQDKPDLVGQSIFAITYHPRFHIRSRILNLATWSQHMLPVLLHELRPYVQESWCRDLMTEIRQGAPVFSGSSDMFRTSRRIPARPLVPIIFQGPGNLALPFWVATEHFIDDARFRVTYYLPADEITYRQCQSWLMEKH
jgi:transcriptional regulator with XRE-family HTH domain